MRSQDRSNPWMYPGSCRYYPDMDSCFTWSLAAQRENRQICQTMLKISSVFMRNSENLYCRKSPTSIIYENYVSAWFKIKNNDFFHSMPWARFKKIKALNFAWVHWPVAVSRCPGRVMTRTHSHYPAFLPLWLVIQDPVRITDCHLWPPCGGSTEINCFVRLGKN